MKKKLLLAFITIICLHAYSQKILPKYDNNKYRIISDTIEFNEFSHINTRIVKFEIWNKINKIISGEIHSCPNDYSKVSELNIKNYKLKQHKDYIWNYSINKGYIYQIFEYKELTDFLKKVHYCYWDNSIQHSFDCKTEKPQNYLQGEKPLDLSIINTFPALFKKLYKEKYGETKITN